VFDVIEAEPAASKETADDEPSLDLVAVLSAESAEALKVLRALGCLCGCAESNAAKAVGLTDR
jgi:hypothetical protein